MASVDLYHGDCLEVMASIPDGSVDSFVSDPPYGMNLKPQRGRTQSILGDGNDEAPDLWAAFLPHAARIAKDDTAHLFFSRWSEAWVKPLLAEHFTVKGCIVWSKTNFGIGYYVRPQWELAYYCHKGKPPKPAKAESDVWVHKRVARPVHSCEKPVGLMERAVRLCAPDGGVVVDPFMGVGSTGLACVNTGRQFIGIERDDKYFAIASERIANARRDMFAA